MVLLGWCKAHLWYDFDSDLFDCCFVPREVSLGVLTSMGEDLKDVEIRYCATRGRCPEGEGWFADRSRLLSACDKVLEGFGGSIALEKKDERWSAPGKVPMLR